MTDLSLDCDQKRVVEAGGGAILLSAGPGSGKTRTLVGRALYLLRLGVPPHRICLLTFTNRAAEEMARRLAETLSAGAAVEVSTFHALSARLLRQHGALLGLPVDFTILNGEEAQDLMAEAIARSSASGRGLRARAVLRLYSVCVNTRTPLEEALTAGGRVGEADAAALRAVFNVYLDIKAELGVLDFDDLLVHAVALLSDHGERLRGQGLDFEHVLVDELQDTNLLQFQMLRALVAAGGNVLAVGDPMQSIYGFRGADPGNFDRFTAVFPRAQRLELGLNYRSTAAIVDLAESLVSGDLGPRRAVTPGGQTPVLAICADAAAEARLVGRRIVELHEQGIGYDEIALLVRLRSQAAVLEEALLEAGVPVRAGAGVRFFATAHVRHVLALLRVGVRPGDRAALARCLDALPSVGPATRRKVLAAVLASNRPLSALSSGRVLRLLPPAAQPLFRRMVALWTAVGPTSDAVAASASAVEVRRAFGGANAPGEWEDLAEFTRFAAGFADLRALLVDSALLASAGGYARRADEESAATLSTIHQSKGRQWPVVFVCGVGEGILPLSRSVGEGRLDEERRILYVAVTRAQRTLTLTCSHWFKGPSGRATRSGPSRFVRNLEDAVLERLA